MKFPAFIAILFIPILFTPKTSVIAELCFFGCQANSVGSINEIYDDYGLTPNVGVVFGKDYKQIKQAALALNNKGAKAVILISDLIFEKVKAADVDCIEYGNIVKSPEELGLKIFEDWQKRLSDFLNTEKEYLNSGNILMIGIADEVNNVCVPSSDIDAVAKFIKASGITIPIGVVYDLSVRGELGRAKPLPEILPESVDVVAVFEYGIFDPGDPQNPLNATKDWNERWNTFKTKLGSRKVVLILNAFCNKLHVQLGWVHACTPEYVKPFAVSAYRWRDWAISEPDVIGILGFSWNSSNYPVSVGTRDMHKVVQNAHQNIINAIDCDFNDQPEPK